MQLYVDNKEVEDFKEVRFVFDDISNNQTLIVSVDQIAFIYELFVGGECVSVENATPKEIANYLSENG
jgi:hypothetical protein